MNRVVKKDRAYKPQAIVSVTHRARIDRARRHSHSYREDQRAVRHPLFERLGVTPLRVHMMRVEVASLSRMQHNIGFSNGAARRLASRAGHIILEKYLTSHGSPFHLAEFSHVDITPQT